MADTANLKYTITVDGAQQGAVAFQNLAQQMGKTEQALGRMSRPANDNAKAFDQISQKAQRATQVFAAATGALGRMDPAFAALSQTVGRATGAIGAMTSMLGGPWGIAIGAGVIALGAFANAMRESEKDTEAQTKALEKQRTQLADNIEAYRKAAQGAFNFSASGADLQAQILAAESMAQGATGSRKRFLLDNAARLRRIQEQQQYESGNAAALKQINELENAAGFEDARGKAPGERGTFAGMSEYEMQRRRLAGAEAAQAERSRLVGGMRTSDELPQRRRKDDQFLKSNADSFNATLDAARSNHGEMMKMEQERADAMQQYRDMAIDAFKDIGNASIQALSAAVRGEKGAGKALLQNIGSILIGRGQDAFWQGVIMNSNPFTPGLGTPMIVAGIGATLAGVTMGGIGAAIGGGGGGAQQRPAAPSAPGNSLSRGGGNTTINFNYRSVMAPTAQDGVHINHGLEEARRQGLIGGRAA